MKRFLTVIRFSQKTEEILTTTLFIIFEFRIFFEQCKKREKKTYTDILTKNDFGRVLTQEMNLLLIHSYLWISKRVRRSQFIYRKCNASRHSHQFRSSVNESAWWKTYPHSCLLLYHLCRLQISNNEFTHAI